MPAHSSAPLRLSGHKNPKVTSEAINTMTQTIQEFGLQSLNVKSLLDWMKEDLGNSNPGVRNAAVQLLGVMHGCVRGCRGLSSMLCTESASGCLQGSLQCSWRAHLKSSQQLACAAQAV
jgi:hypothetical protein